MIRRPPRSTLSSSSAASDVYKRQVVHRHASHGTQRLEAPFHPLESREAVDHRLRVSPTALPTAMAASPLRTLWAPRSGTSKRPNVLPSTRTPNDVPLLVTRRLSLIHISEPTRLLSI